MAKKMEPWIYSSIYDSLKNLSEKKSMFYLCVSACLLLCIVTLNEEKLLHLVINPQVCWMSRPLSRSPSSYIIYTPPWAKQMCIPLECSNNHAWQFLLMYKWLPVNMSIVFYLFIAWFDLINNGTYFTINAEHSTLGNACEIHFSSNISISHHKNFQTFL